MKIFLTLSLFLFCSWSFAQNKLSSSKEAGYYTYIYKITEQETAKIASKGKDALSDTFFHTLVDSFYTDKGYKKHLAFGNYIYVSTYKNTIRYRFEAVGNVELHFINNLKEFQFFITDLSGNLLPNAKVNTGKGKVIRFDHQSQLYKTSYPKKEDFIQVEFNGVANFFSFDLESTKPYNHKQNWNFFKKVVYSSPLRYTWTPLQSLFSRRKNKSSQYQGFMVFSKPKYKPLDTIKFKAYVLTSSGKKINNKIVEVVLSDNRGKQKLLANIKPYRDGGYSYDFVLADSLNLTLDRNYTVALMVKDKRGSKTLISRNFLYEDYELKSLKFAVRTDRVNHQLGAPATIFFKATDENELAVPDGRVEILGLTSYVSRFSDTHVFIPDTLWKRTINLEPVGETKLVLPDSIFPKADLNFLLRFNFRNSNNETRSETKNLSYIYKSGDKPLEEIKSVLKKDSLLIDYRVNDQSNKHDATILSYSSAGILLDSFFVTLPATLKIDFRIDHYRVIIANGTRQDVFLSDFKPVLDIAALQNKDSLRVVVNNVHKVPFWYTIFSGNKVLIKGFTNALDTVFKHSRNNMAHIRINYFWDGSEISKEASVAFNDQQLNLRLIAPDMVYPGQEVNMRVKVTDANDKPVAETDLTAYAFTSKFENDNQPALPNFEKKFYARRKKNFEVESDYISLNANFIINWEKWGRKLGLDTIEYYKFTHPKSFYSIQEIAKDTITQVAPFAVLNGAILPVNIVYIDDIPVYFSQADQLARYSFPVKPGKHSFRLRTAGQTISLTDVEIPKGKKTIFSVLADRTNKIASVVKSPYDLSLEESEQLNKYMLKIQDNFDSEKAILSADQNNYLLNSPPSVYSGRELLIGPIGVNYLTFRRGSIVQDFIKEPGYTYTFTPGLIKQKSYRGIWAFSSVLSSQSNNDNINYKQYAIRKNEIDSLWNNYLDLRSHTTQLFNNNRVARTTHTGRLSYKIDTVFTNRLPYIKNIIIYKPDEPDFVQIYSGNNNYLPSFEAGKYKIMFLLKDNRYFTAEDILIKSNGQNFYSWKTFRISEADSLSTKLDQYIKNVRSNHDHETVSTVAKEEIERFNEKNFDLSNLKGLMTGRVLSAKDGVAIAGASVKVVGLSAGVSTDREGKFAIKIPKRGKVQISYIGYEHKEVSVVDGAAGNILLDEKRLALNEVVVVGYGAAKKSTLTGSISSISGSLAGKAAGLTINNNTLVTIRGVMSLPTTEKPIIIVDGVPFAGDINMLSADNITNVDILKSSDAVAIYGSRASNGVIIIKTKKGVSGVNDAGELVSQQQTMRTKFSDQGFWKPTLITDENGISDFKVKFPDDITNWKTRVIAAKGKQVGLTETNIKSFKSLSANFFSPQFALSGDSIKVIGKIMNYTPLEEILSRKFLYNGTEMLNSSIKVKNSYLDTVDIVVKEKDSLKFEYTLKQENGYFDGELRKIPVYKPGVTETKGYFSALLADTIINYSFDKKLGKVVVRVESSVFPTLLDEMTKLREYKYLCNEQLASKLKSLLLEKQVRKYLGESFNHEKDILYIIKKLKERKNPQGTWGWWQNGEEQMWISLHVVEALLQCEKEGFKVELNKTVLYKYLIEKLTQESDYNQLSTIKLLNLLDDKHYIKDWLLAFERKKKQASPNLYERLAFCELKQLAGLKVNVDSLLSIRKETMFGNIYWGNEGIKFWDNSIQNTILAYRILKRDGGHEGILEKITLYFLEQRKDGHWRNTFESALILETILPEMLLRNLKNEPASVKIGGQLVYQFPYDKVIENVGHVKLEKSGKMPVYFTAYQTFHNAHPEKVNKDFTVNTSFVQDGATVKKLKAGTLTTLKVVVNVRADAEYVMIEIPIPAGCSYENKRQNFWGVETHREYYKNKTSIFCNKLKQGTYTFDVDLMPRYAGSYSLNPAKAEMMYFPVFYGREEIKKVGIN